MKLLRAQQPNSFTQQAFHLTPPESRAERERGFTTPCRLLLLTVLKGTLKNPLRICLLFLHLLWQDVTAMKLLKTHLHTARYYDPQIHWIWSRHDLSVNILTEILKDSVNMLTCKLRVFFFICLFFLHYIPLKWYIKPVCFGKGLSQMSSEHWHVFYMQMSCVANCFKFATNWMQINTSIISWHKKALNRV